MDEKNYHGAGYDQLYQQQRPDPAVPSGTGGMSHDPRYGAMDNAGYGNIGQQQNPRNEQNLAGRGAGHNFAGTRAADYGTGAGVDSNIRDTGTHDDYGTNARNEHGVPPTSAINSSRHTGSGSGSRGSGKVEKAVSALIGSSSLKAKGLQKEQEANAMKVQSAELAEAERLEQEALMRRERAVAHGAHPHNKHLGSSSMPGSNRNPGRNY